MNVNTATAIMAILGGLLCARGYFPHVKILGGSAANNLARGLGLSALGVFPRVFWWDLTRLLLGQEWWPVVRDLMGGVAINAGFNLILLAGVYFVLRARYLIIPEDERGRYNVITAAWYPKTVGLRLLIRRDD